MLSATELSSMPSIPTLHFMVGSFFVTRATVFLSLSYTCFMLAFGGKTPPIFGLGIFPLGPKNLPKIVATFGITEAWAMKKSCLFASFFTSALFLNLSNWSDVITSSQLSLTLLSMSLSTKAHTETFFPVS